MRFKDQVVVVTGAASGIGKGTAEAFASAGAKVVVSDIQVEKGEEVAAAIRASGGSAVFVAANVADYAAVEHLMEATLEQFGPVDILINNAGIGGDRNPTHQFSRQAWDRVLAVNQTGVFYGMQLALRQMLPRQKGCIVNIASIAGLKGFPLQLGYAATKHAVVGMTKTAALEYATQNIRINALCPVFIDTPMVDLLISLQDGMEERLKKAIPQRKIGEVADVVNAIFWLCDPASAFITGLILPVDGGMMAG